MIYQLVFDRDIQTHEQKLTGNKRIIGIFQVRIYSKDVSGCTEHRENATFGLDCKLTLQRNSDKNVLSHGPAIGSPDADRVADIRAIGGKIHKSDISWYVPHFTPNISQKNYC